MSTKEICTGDDTYQRILAGLNKAANVITTTLGPKGRNVVIEQPGKELPRITKDGVSVAKEIHLSDPFENMAAELLAQISEKTCDDAGDGTTTASLLAQNIFKEGVRAVSMGMNPVDLKTGIDIAVDLVVNEIKKMSKPVDGKKDLMSIATISANGDTHIGSLLADAFERIGEDGLLTLMEGTSTETTLDFETGVAIGSGFHESALSCITHESTSTCEYTNCAVFLYDDSFPSSPKIMKVLEVAGRKEDRDPIPLLVTATAFDVQTVMPIINLNNVRNATRICPVTLPYISDDERAIQYRYDFLSDYAVITGAKLMPREQGIVFTENFSDEYFGYADQIIVSRYQTIIIGGRGKPEDVERHKQNLIEERIKLREKVNFDEDYDKHLGNRLKNFNGVATVRAGGRTAVEISERKDRIEDAMHATRASIAEGIVPGGGMTLLRTTHVLDTFLNNNPNDISLDVKTGINVVRLALNASFEKIISNAGKNPAVILPEILKEDNIDFGYDAKNDKIVNMIESGIIDPAKVVRSCIQNAASIAGLLLTTSAMITYEDRDPNPLSNMKFKM